MKMDVSGDNFARTIERCLYDRDNVHEIRLYDPDMLFVTNVSVSFANVKKIIDRHHCAYPAHVITRIHTDTQCKPHTSKISSSTRSSSQSSVNARIETIAEINARMMRSMKISLMIYAYSSLSEDNITWLIEFLVYLRGKINVSIEFASNDWYNRKTFDTIMRSLIATPGVTKLL